MWYTKKKLNWTVKQSMYKLRIGLGNYTHIKEAHAYNVYLASKNEQIKKNRWQILSKNKALF